MGSRYEVEVTLGSARDLKNVNWRNGELRPYAVLWIDDDGPKCSTRVGVAIDNGNGENPNWDWEDEKVLVPLPLSLSSRLEDAVLRIDVVHATNAADEVEVKNPLVGSARLPLRDVIDEVGVGGGKVSRTLRLKRPSGRPQGRLDVRVAVHETAAAARYYDHNPINPASPYSAAASGYDGSSVRDPYYSKQPAPAGPYAAPPAGYPVPAGYAGAPPQQPEYGAAAPPPAPAAVVDPSSQTNHQKNKMGMGTGLAVGAAAGVLGGLALAGGASYLEDKFEESVAERVEEDLAAAGDDDEDGACYGDDDY